MGKAIHQIITLNIQGSEKAVVGTGEMLESVVEALQSQFPKLKIEATAHQGSVVEKPFLMLPTKLTKPEKPVTTKPTKKEQDDNQAKAEA